MRYPRTDYYMVVSHSQFTKRLCRMQSPSLNLLRLLVVNVLFLFFFVAGLQSRRRCGRSDVQKWSSRYYSEMCFLFLFLFSKHGRLVPVGFSLSLHLKDPAGNSPTATENTAFDSNNVGVIGLGLLCAGSPGLSSFLHAN